MWGFTQLKHTVRCVKPIETTYQYAVRECYKNIAWCDILLVIVKPDDNIGESVTHELCFAGYLEKTIYIIRSKE